MGNEVERTIFGADVVLPAQMSCAARCVGNTSGARALMLAILADAMLCVARGRRRRHPRTRQLAAEVETWMRSDCREWLFSFASICDVLGIDADALRARLRINVEPASRTGPAVRAEGDERSARSRSVTRRLPQRESARESVAVDTAREPTGHSVRGRGTGSGFAVRARLELA
ncbi:MAG: hypothetical protein ABI624_14300 [Casimicrobiaceae bacterium]